MTRGKKKSWEYFDDCAVCQAMREADKEDRELGLDELQAAFVKVNRHTDQKD